MGLELITAAAATAGNANMDFAVPAQKGYRVCYGQVVLTTDATVANRRVVLSLLDAAGAAVLDSHAGAVVAASQTSQHHEFLQGIYRETSFVGGALQIPIGQDVYLLPGWKLRVAIENGVAGDSFTGKFMVDVL